MVNLNDKTNEQEGDSNEDKNNVKPSVPCHDILSVKKREGQQVKKGKPHIYLKSEPSYRSQYSKK